MHEGERNDQTFVPLSALAHVALLDRPRCATPGYGHDRRQGHPEVSAVVLRSVVEAEESATKPAKITAGTRSLKDPKQRSADARRIHQQGSSSNRQQNVRVRDDSITMAGTRILR